MDLFGWRREKLAESESPLAARMRPQTLDEFAGQAHLIGPGRLLRRAIQADQLSSLIFFGPPGTGKTTLARIIANTTRGYFHAINAVLAGVKDLREAVQEAQRRLGENGQRTILFVDEVHRFNKSQQDALLPWVENGTVILIGATTENPYFEVNKALVSRSRVFQLRSLEPEDLRDVALRAISTMGRGFGHLKIELGEEALEHLLNVANGDARALLNALELAIETTPENEAGVRVITLEVAEESIQRRAVLYDKEGDAHFDTISAFIKSVRGSDPDAALYWLAKMDYAGEEPRFIFRRLLILASEDIGLADPQALVVTEACAAAFDRVGMPEGRFHLAQATLYLANTAKSNSTLGYFDALKAIQHEREGEVPNHLKDGSRDKKGFGHGKGYLYPHSYRDHWVAQQYLPSTLQGQSYYQPSSLGWEGEIQAKVARQREAQLAALMDDRVESSIENLTYSPEDKTHERWLQRTLGQAGERAASLRDKIFQLARPQRHHVILDLNGGSGLLSWEALRRVPEGGVYTRVEQKSEQESLEAQAAAFSALLRPSIVCCPLDGLSQALEELDQGLRFDRIVGRNVLPEGAQRLEFLQSLEGLLLAGGLVVLSQVVPRRAQRLHQLLQSRWLGDELSARLATAEEEIYEHAQESSLRWDVEDLRRDLSALSLKFELHVETSSSRVCLTASLLNRWFSHHPEKPSFADRLKSSFSVEEIERIEQAFVANLKEKIVPWSNTTLFVVISGVVEG